MKGDKMADYSNKRVKSLRQYETASKENSPTLQDELIDIAIQQSEAITELDKRVKFLENKKS